MVRPCGTEAPGARNAGRPMYFDELRARVSSWPPPQLARLRRERGSVSVVSPPAPVLSTNRRAGQCVIGLDIRRAFAEAVAWEEGRLFRLGPVDMTRTALEGFGKGCGPATRWSRRRPATRWRSCGCCRLRGSRGHRQSAAGEGDRARPREDGQDRRRRSGEPARGRLPAGGLDPRPEAERLAGSWRVGTSSSGTAPGSRTKSRILPPI